MLRRAMAVVIAVLLAHSAVGTAVADDLVVEMKIPAPEKYVALGWKFGDKLAPGFWYSSQQIVAVSKRIDYLETAAAKECVDAQIAEAKKLSKWIYVAGGILTGVAVGYCAGHSGHCGIYK